jgi:hypothetical protein
MIFAVPPNFSGCVVQPALVVTYNGVNRIPILRADPLPALFKKPLSEGFRCRCRDERFQPLALHSLARIEQLLVPIFALHNQLFTEAIIKDLSTMSSRSKNVILPML